MGCPAPNLMQIHHSRTGERGSRDHVTGISCTWWRVTSLPLRREERRRDTWSMKETCSALDTKKTIFLSVPSSLVGCGRWRCCCFSDSATLQVSPRRLNPRSIKNLTRRRRQRQPSCRRERKGVGGTLDPRPRWWWRGTEHWVRYDPPAPYRMQCVVKSVSATVRWNSLLRIAF